MRDQQIDLSIFPGEYLSKEQFYKIAHIKKDTALWLLESGLVESEKPERKGFGYKIPKEAVAHYLIDRTINPAKYSKTNRCNRYPHGPEIPYSAELSAKIRTIVAQEIADLPDVLAAKEISVILGYRLKHIYEWHHSCGLKCLIISKKLFVPKTFLLDFVASREYHNIREKSKEHIELLRRVQYE